mgnify:CR=1 FL=1
MNNSWNERSWFVNDGRTAKIIPEVVPPRLRAHIISARCGALSCDAPVFFDCDGTRLDVAHFFAVAVGEEVGADLVNDSRLPRVSGGRDGGFLER